MHISACRYLYTTFRYIWLSAAFSANGKVWVGSDNQAHDALSHNCMHDNVETGKFEILDDTRLNPAESIFNGDCVPELSIPVPVITKQVDEQAF